MMQIPPELQARQQWVVWRYEKDGKPATAETPGATKVPYSARTKRKASSKNPNDWASFEEAMSISGFSGVGYVFAEDDPYVGIDLDDCIEGDTVAPWAQAILDAMPSYAEISPSGKGLKLALGEEEILTSSEEYSVATSR